MKKTIALYLLLLCMPYALVHASGGNETDDDMPCLATDSEEESDLDNENSNQESDKNLKKTTNKAISIFAIEQRLGRKYSKRATDKGDMLVAASDSANKVLGKTKDGDSITPKNISELNLHKKLQGATFYEKTELNGIVLLSPDFLGATLREVDFRQSTLMFPDFSGADLTDANFEGVKMVGATFTKATLDNANFSSAHLHKSTFNKAKLYCTNFEGANLRNCDMSDVKAEEVIFKNASLLCIPWIDSSFLKCEFEGAKIFHKALLHRGLVDYGFFNGTDFTGSRFVGYPYFEGVKVKIDNDDDCELLCGRVAQAKSFNGAWMTKDLAQQLKLEEKGVITAMSPGVVSYFLYDKKFYEREESINISVIANMILMYWIPWW